VQQCDLDVVRHLAIAITFTDHPPPENAGLHAQVCIEYCTKPFGGRGPAGELTYSAPAGGIAGLSGNGWTEGKSGEGRGKEGRGKKRRGKEGKGERREGKGGRYTPPFRFSGCIHGLLCRLSTATAAVLFERRRCNQALVGSNITEVKPAR